MARVVELATKFAPTVGRYVAVLLVGVLLAALNKLNIQLDPDTVDAITTGLTGVFVALLLFGFRRMNKDEKKAANVAAVAAITGQIPASVVDKASPALAAQVVDTPHTKIV